MMIDYAKKVKHRDTRYEKIQDLIDDAIVYVAGFVTATCLIAIFLDWNF